MYINNMKFEKISEHRRAYWANMDPKEKEKRMSTIAKKRIASMTPQQKREWAMKCVAARKRKRIEAYNKRIAEQAIAQSVV